MMKERLRRVLIQIKEDGVRTTLYFIFFTSFKNSLVLLERGMKKIGMRDDLPSANSTTINHGIWDNYNWKQRGEEWTQSAKWKQSLIDEILFKYVEPGKIVLEIGPGAGRWSEALQRISSRLILVDLSEKCMELCKKRFSKYNNVEFFVNDGKSLDFTQEETIDFIWSFDVFVHINPEDTESYIKEFRRVLKKGGRGVIHHPEGVARNAWKSSMTDQLFSGLLKKNGFTLIDQFGTFGKNKRYNVGGSYETITVFEK